MKILFRPVYSVIITFLIIFIFGCHDTSARVELEMTRESTTYEEGYRAGRLRQAALDQAKYVEYEKMIDSDMRQIKEFETVFDNGTKAIKFHMQSYHETKF